MIEFSIEIFDGSGPIVRKNLAAFVLPRIGETVEVDWTSYKVTEVKHTVIESWKIRENNYSETQIYVKAYQID